MGILAQFVLRALGQVTTVQVHWAGEPLESAQGLAAATVGLADCGYFFPSPHLLPAFVTLAPQH